MLAEADRRENSCFRSHISGLTVPRLLSTLRALCMLACERESAKSLAGKRFSGVSIMYAVIATGGKQYRVEKGQVLRVEKLDAEPGATVTFDKVLLVGSGSDVKVGAPLLSGASVTGTVERHGKGAKVSIVKFRRRKHYLRMKNHRQLYTEIKVTEIV